MINERRNGDQITLRQHSHNTETMKKLSKFRKEGMLCDITVIVNGKRFGAHKNILASGSQYFSAMFTTKMSESSQSEVTLESLCPEVFEQILEYFYEGALVIDMNSIADTLHAASLLLLKDIQNECFYYLRRNLTIKNCVFIKSIGEIYSNKDLIKKTNEFLVKNFQRLAQEVEVANFSLKDLKALLKNEDLMCKSEDVIATVVNKWLSARPSADVSTEDVAALLKTIRIPALSEDGLTILTSTIKDLDKKNRCKNFEKSLAAETRIQNRSCKRCGVKYRVAHSKERILFCAGRYGDCYGYSLSSNKFRKLETYPEMQLNGVIADGNTVYAIGTSNVFALNLILYAYDTRENKWTQLPAMSRSRSQHSLSVLNGKLYVIGGRNRDSSTSDAELARFVESYDPAEKVWTTKSSTRVPRVNSCAASTSKYIYIIGGESTDDTVKAVNTVERFCPLKEEWMSGPSLTTKRYMSSAVYFHEKIYVFGGRNLVELLTFEFLETNGKHWNQVAFPYASPICSAVTIDGKILALGNSLWGDDLAFQYYAQRRRGHWQKVNNFIHTSHRNSAFKYAAIEVLNYDFENKPLGNCNCHQGDSSNDEDYMTDSSDIEDSDDVLMEFAPWGLWV